MFNRFKINNPLHIISLLIILLSIVINISISLYSIPYRATLDDFQHFYDMYKWYEKKEIPYTGTRFELCDTYKEEFTMPRVPGGIYYIIYTLFYKLSSENLNTAKIINYVFSLIIIIIFLIWVGKRFDYIVLAFMSVLILCNGYLIRALTLFWNPNIALIFSFIFFIFMFEYVYESNDAMVKLSAVFIFPVLAIMAQAHFSVFFSMVPTVIIYLLIKFKKTLKYIFYWIIGIFISFLLYLPYLVHEINNNFYNTVLMLQKKGETSNIGFPQYQAFVLFPSNEMSSIYMRNLDNILNFWFSNPSFVYGFILLILSLIFTAICLIGSFYIIINKKQFILQTKKEIAAREMFLILLLSIIVSTIFFMIAPPRTSSFHYLYGVFALSFSPILFFILKFEEKLINRRYVLYILFLFLIFYSFAMFGTVKRYIDNYEYNMSVNVHKEIENYIKKQN
ncbi:hypothetical protein [uncultured Brachyspira sp.]|uniref:hypothetical protein n=2 Tax=uncultured Brachyspira sp. TaxID=221953 RepID=UPI0026213843|nr:hypothetical protein [uncultured Brachyspira sp.]